MNQSNSAELDSLLNEIFLDSPHVTEPHRALSDAVDAVRVASSFACSQAMPSKKFDTDLKVYALELQEKIRSASEEAIDRVLAQNGYGKGVSCRFRVHSSHRVSIKSSVDSGKSYTAIINMILTREGALASQVFIRTKVQQMYPNASVTKNWNQPLPIWAIRNVKTRLIGLGAPFDCIKLKRGATLNDLHAASKTAVEKSQGVATTFKPEVLLKTHLFPSIVIKASGTPIAKLIQDQTNHQVKPSSSCFVLVALFFA